MTTPAAGGGPPRYAPIPRSALGPPLNDQGYHVGRVERNLYWVTDGVYQAAFLATPAADIEIFTRTTAFAIMQSLRLDRGPSGPVHP